VVLFADQARPLVMAFGLKADSYVFSALPLAVKVAMSVAPGLSPPVAETATVPSGATATALAGGLPGSVPYEATGDRELVVKDNGGYPSQTTRKVPPPAVMASPSSSDGQSSKW
jgi:hypothetical protein